MLSKPSTYRPNINTLYYVTRICAAEMAVRYAALSACRKYGCPQCMPKSTSVTLAVDEKTLRMATITGRTDRQTDRRTDRVRRNMRPPPREEGRIIIIVTYSLLAYSSYGDRRTNALDLWINSAELALRSEGTWLSGQARSRTLGTI